MNEFLREGDELPDWLTAHPARPNTLPPPGEWRQRVEREFSATSQQMLEKIRQEIPDATAEDLQRWTDSGEIQSVRLAGERRYFRREPANLFRRSEEARKRSGRQTAAGDAAAAATQGSTLPNPRIQMAQSVLQQVAETKGIGKLPKRRVIVEHTISVPGEVIARERPRFLRLWYPIPVACTYQSGPTDLQYSAGQPIGEPNPLCRTLYFTFELLPGDHRTFSHSISYQFDCSARAPLAFAQSRRTAGPGAETATESEIAQAVRTDEPHLGDPQSVRTIAEDLRARVASSSNRPYAKAAWLWIHEHVRYMSEMEYAVIPDCTDKVLATREGDCGVQALLFIALCRAAGVPARWRSGWTTRDQHWSMHDWAEFYDEATQQWMPVDVSFGRLDNPSSEIADFYFGNLDEFRMVTNLAHAQPMLPAKGFHRSDPVDNQRGEVETESRNLGYDDWDYDVYVTTIEPTGGGEKTVG